MLISEPFLFKIATPIIAAIISPSTASIVSVLKFLTLFAITTSTIAVAIVLLPESLYIWRIGESKLTICNTAQFALNGIVVYNLLVPVVVSKLHIICYCIGKAEAFVCIFFFERFFYDDLQIFSQVRMFGISLGIR